MRRHLSRLVLAAYAAALLAPVPHRWAAPFLPVLLCVVMFGAGLRVPVHGLPRLVRRPRVLVAGLAVRFVVPLLVVPAVAFALHRSPDADGGSGVTAALIVTAAMPVAAGATVWTGRGHGDQATMVGLVLATTLLGPFTIPLTVTALAPLLSDPYAATLTDAAHRMGSGPALTGVLVPCVAGVVCRAVLPSRVLDPVGRGAAPTALVASLLLTYANAGGAIGPFLARPRFLLLAAAVAVAGAACGLSFAAGRVATRVLRLDRSTGTSVTLACGMNNSSASAVLLSSALPDRPHLLLPVLAYGMLQKLAASRVSTAPPRPDGKASVPS
ncbi:bile acid:sodium symporter [Streptomyces beihaiensis]|uniref:Bile acid:sodium symporter n=1 Tax=Streptomyces beihaiensis TaxID=2984495 RepID=A0ABT3TZ34_9ACTN|nr:bile acid:sodium symporter [Streptomyces beihaiensis]MCX3062313.1 bile acid:sodium symporter [Streptomyces beihaiensis]